MEFRDVLNKRHSVRNFSEREIPVQVLENIVRAAERAPSWENSQPWNVYIATGDIPILRDSHRPDLPRQRIRVTAL